MAEEPENPEEPEIDDADEDDEPDAPFTSADFHTVVQKQILNAVYDTLAETKLDWETVAPFLETAREMCRADFEEAARIRIHTVQAEGEKWVDAEEAFIGISVPDRDDGTEWLSETRWISEIALEDPDPKQVRAAIKGLERSIAKLNAWLAEQEAGGPTNTEPPAERSD